MMLSADNVLHIQTYEAALGKKQYHLCEHGVDLLLHAVAEAVDGREVGMLVACHLI